MVKKENCNRSSGGDLRDGSGVFDQPFDAIDGVAYAGNPCTPCISDYENSYATSAQFFQNIDHGQHIAQGAVRTLTFAMVSIIKQDEHTYRQLALEDLTVHITHSVRFLLGTRKIKWYWSMGGIAPLCL